MTLGTKMQPTSSTYIEAQDLYIELVKEMSRKAHEMGFALSVIRWLKRLVQSTEHSRRRVSIRNPESEASFLRDIMFFAGQRGFENTELHHILLRPPFQTGLGEMLAERIKGQLRTRAQRVTVFASSAALSGSGFTVRIVKEYPAFCIVSASEETIAQIKRRFPVGLSELSDTILTGAPLGPSDEAWPPEPEALEQVMTYHVIHFRLPITDELKKRLEAVGVRVIQSRGRSSLIVLGSEDAIKEIRKEIRDFPEIGNVEPFEPDVRIRSESVGITRRSLRMGESTLSNQDAVIGRRRSAVVPGIYLANFFTKEDSDKAANELAKAGIEILERPNATRLVLNIIHSDDALRDLLKIIEQTGLRLLEEEAIETPSNDVARLVVGKGVVSPHLVFPQFPLTGQGEVLAIADSGLDTGFDSTMHLDFRNRIRAIKSYPLRHFGPGVLNVGEDKGPADMFSGHGTHVAGSAVGSGAQAIALGLPPIQGIAPDAELIFQAVEQAIIWNVELMRQRFPDVILDPYGFQGLPRDLATLFEFAYHNGARVHLNSWGAKAKKGEYTGRCGDLDDFVWRHKDFLVIIAAGNGGVQKGASIEPMSVSPPGTAKNCLTVGASENGRQGQFDATYGAWWPHKFDAPPFNSKTMVDSIEHIVPFSGRGPCAPQGRRKPDIVAPGTFILSTRSTQMPSNHYGWSSFPAAKDYYMYLGGTSMAAPLVAGAALLIRQYLRTEQGLANPSAALVKAALIHSAAYMNCPNRHPTALPWSDNEQGWGRLCLENVLAPSAPAHVIFIDNVTGLKTGEKDDYVVRITNTSVPLKVTLVYSDYPADTLVNDLNLQLFAPDGTYFLGNDFDGSLRPDNINNVEGVLIHPQAVGEWKITVVGTEVAETPQDYALVISGGGAQLK